MKHLLLISSFFLLTGCASNAPQHNTTYGWLGFYYSAVSNASYVQWNHEYAVTVAHFKMDNSSVYTSDIYDVQFIKMPSKNIAQWANYKIDEHVTMKGFSYASYHQEYSGTITDHTNLHMGQRVYPLVNLNKHHIEQGMSGGPIVNSSNQVLGINVGYTQDPVLINGKKEIHSLFLPYKYIKEEWDKFQSQKKAPE